MKKCTECGLINDDNDNFCLGCGCNKFVEEADSKPSSTKGGLNIGDANAIDADELIGHKEEIHGIKEEIHGNKEEINAQNVTVNHTIVNQTTTVDSEIVELEKQKRIIEMEKMKFEAELVRAQAIAANIDASSKQVGLKEANDQAQVVAGLKAAVQEREAELISAMALMEGLVLEQEREEAAREADNSKEIEKKRKELISKMESSIYDLERASESTLSGEIGRKSYFIWGSLTIAFFIIAAATAIPFFWILLLITLIMTVVTAVKKVKMGSANANNIKKEELLRSYGAARRDLEIMQEFKEENSALIADFNKRIQQSEDKHEQGVKSAAKKANIFIIVIALLAIVVAVVVAGAVISSLPVE